MYFAANEALLDDEKELYRVYIGIVGKKGHLYAAVYGNTPEVAKQNADNAVELLNADQPKLSTHY